MYQRPKHRWRKAYTPIPRRSGRYAKLVSDFDDFAAKPFACALCFFRCSDVHSLITHAENHLTGCNQFQVPETARFTSGPDGTSENTDTLLTYKSLSEKPESASDINKPDVSHIRESLACQPDLDKPHNHLDKPRKSPIKPIKPFKEFPATKLNIDRLIPTFSVHYRKDKTNPAKPYLCLMCRKRFRHLPMLKQHFRQAHNENGSANNQKFECEPCSLTFNTPMALQEHHEIHH
ncbi:hypothetical protein FSP39_020806 [Pinctada imbricata]|uniref:C2H2-type domain-containing protein n=1 Tax=Pinctada imbricata TaxID=66713 RepID=A0AA88Y1D5_PINIB|nr:hypothetical protein FSP39_020806 [Pinctada imbricata]